MYLKDVTLSGKTFFADAVLKEKTWARMMDQQLRAFAFLGEDRGLGPSTFVAAYNHL